MKRFLSSWQGLVAGIIAILIFWYSPVVVHSLDKTAGVFSVGDYLQWMASATAVALFGVFVAWVCWQIAFRSFDRWADKLLRETFERQSEKFKIIAVQVSFGLMLIYWLACLRAIPMQ